MISARSNRTLSDLVHAHAGRPAIVLGGAPCWPSDYARVREWPDACRAVYLAANDHAFRGDAIVDYIVSCDHRYTDEKGVQRDMEPRLRIHRRPIISPRFWADYRILHMIVGNSAALACVVAWAMGCAPIVVCGVELYTGGTYAHDPKAYSVGKTVTVAQQLERWQKVTAAIPHAQIRPVSGPLSKIWPTWDPLEPAAAPAPAQEIQRIVGGVRVTIVRDVPPAQGGFPAGSTQEVRATQADQLIREGYARRMREAA